MPLTAQTLRKHNLLQQAGPAQEVALQHNPPWNQAVHLETVIGPDDSAYDVEGRRTIVFDSMPGYENTHLQPLSQTSSVECLYNTDSRESLTISPSSMEGHAANEYYDPDSLPWYTDSIDDPNAWGNALAGLGGHLEDHRRQEYPSLDGFVVE
jgi:hypothetical protein